MEQDGRTSLRREGPATKELQVLNLSAGSACASNVSLGLRMFKCFSHTAVCSVGQELSAQLLTLSTNMMHCWNSFIHSFSLSYTGAGSSSQLIQFASQAKNCQEPLSHSVTLYVCMSLCFAWNACTIFSVTHYARLQFMQGCKWRIVGAVLSMKQRLWRLKHSIYTVGINKGCTSWKV